MDTNGHSAVVLPQDETRWATTIEQDRDARQQPFAVMKEEHRKFYTSDMQQLDGLESDTLAAIAKVKREWRPEFQQDQVQAIGDKALNRLEDYESNRVNRLVSEHARLVASVPKELQRSELAENTQTAKDLYVLSQLDRDTMSDPLKLRIAYLEAIEQRNIGVILAIERDPMGRGQRSLKDEDLRRGLAVRGLQAAPALQAQIDAYATMIARYHQRYARMKQRFRGEGWTDVDPIKEMAQGRATDGAA